MLMASMTVNLRTEYGHNFNQILTEALHWGCIGRVVKDGDLNTEVLADLENDFTPETQQAVFMCQDEFFDFALQQQEQELLESRFLVVHAAAQIFNYHIHGFARLSLNVRFLTLQVGFLVMG